MKTEYHEMQGASMIIMEMHSRGIVTEIANEAATPHELM